MQHRRGLWCCAMMAEHSKEDPELSIPNVISEIPLFFEEQVCGVRSGIPMYIHYIIS